MTETEEPSRPRRPQRPPPRPPKPEPIPTAILVPLLLALLSPLALAWRRALSAEFGGGPNRCAMTYMQPAYFPVPVNASHGPNATTYALWLYRERAASTLTAGGAMASVGNGGGTGCGSAIWRAGRSIPGIFVPGNAGSYRQVRSLASETARRVDARRAASGDAPEEATDAREREHVGVDWFTLDFNEELSAFHGAVARRQTEFAALAIERVLAAYPPSTPVIIAGHSMGGVVARAALLEIKGIAASVDATVVTIATPHEKSPAATQPAIARFYERTNRAWVDANNADVTSRVAMVSVGGGDADRQVRPARAKPPTAWTNGNGRRRKSFNVTHAVAGSIPGATGVSADHRCVVWCQQIVVPIAETLLDVASAERRDDAGGRVALARTRLGPVDEDARNQKPKPKPKPKPKTGTRLDAAAALALDRSPSLVPIMLALAIDALVVPQTTRRGGFGVEGATVRGATSLFAAPVFVRSRVVLVFVLGGFVLGGFDGEGGGGGIPRGGTWGWGLARGVLGVPANLASAFAAYAFAASALTLEALALDFLVQSAAKIYVKTGLRPNPRRTTRRKVGDVTTVVDVSRRGFHVPFIATVAAVSVSIWCPGAGIVIAVTSRLASAVRTAASGLGPSIASAGFGPAISTVDDFGEGDAARTCATLRLLLTCQSASMLAPSFVATVHAFINGGEKLATFASSFVPVARAGWEDVVLAVCTAAPAAFFAFAPLAYATLERDWTSFNELPPSTPAVSAAASSRAVRAGDLATLTGYVVAEALALRAAAPGCAHWSQHAAAAATVLPLLAGSAAAAWSARGVFSGTSRAGVDDGRDVGSKELRGSDAGKPKAE